MITKLPSYVHKSSSVGGAGLIHVSSLSGIDGLVVAATSLITVPRDYVFLQAVIRLTAKTGAVTVGVARIRDTTAGVDLVANTTLTALTTAGKMFPLSMTDATVNSVVPAGDVIVLDITTAFTVATVATLSVDILGYLL